MYKVSILPKAKDDIYNSVQWYNNKQLGLGNRFLKEVREKVLLIRKHPQISPIRYDQIRTIILDIFPYMIHYSIDDKNQIILILAVFHTSQNPENWKKG